ncbi:MAG: cytochrome P450 [Terriglobus roseus]|nr:cytochrome P450 [Terriglobus roseus]
MYERIDGTATAATVLFPWFPGPAMLRRTAAGAQIYKMIGDVIKERKAEGRREDDALQFLLDQGDDTLGVLTVRRGHEHGPKRMTELMTSLQFIMGALFAGQVNSGVNAAWMLVYLANEPAWLNKVYEEMRTACAKSGADQSLPLVEQLSRLSMEQWEGGFPTIDHCLKETIRIQMQGTGFRRNMTGRDVSLGDVTVPAGSVVAYLIDEAHMDPGIYAQPELWDPARYAAGRAEDRKQPMAWVGWGAGRHPCLGMRFAKLEMNIIVALFVAAFEFELCDADGRPRGLPHVERNATVATRPADRPFLKFRAREGGLK